VSTVSFNLGHPVHAVG